MQKAIEKVKIILVQSKIIIVGAGPSGASLAIRLAKKNFRVTLIEREKFPRHKLCGEFISPECLTHFRDLEVSDQMLSCGGDRIKETVFYAPNGTSVKVPSRWFGGDSQGALSLSRARMDFLLLKKARELGVEILEETQVTGVLMENNKISGVKIKFKNGEKHELTGDLTTDATGRAGVLTKLAEKSNSLDLISETAKIQNSKPNASNRLVGFKSHLKNVNLEKGRCEIYFFPGGYSGLSFIENGFANHCFLLRAAIVKEFSGDVDKIVKKVVLRNKRAFETMNDAETTFEWLAVSVEGFGEKELNPAKNLFTVGDASLFIDPFTGSGMLTALEGAEILAQCISENPFNSQRIAENYRFLHHRKFQNRLRVCALLRRAAFASSLTTPLISALSFSGKLLEILARSTRQNLPAIEK